MGPWAKGLAMAFANRVRAGQQLARRLAARLGDRHDGEVVVLGLPRGGVPVAFEVARALHAPLDVLVVRKLGVPGQPELAMGALGEDGVRVLNREVLDLAEIDADELVEVERAERAEVNRRAREFRGERTPAALAGRVALIVDDGVATGATARAACQVARARGAKRVVLAVPVAALGVIDDLADACDDVVCVETPRWLSSVGQWYDDFTQTSDRQVRDLLAAADRSAMDFGGGPTEGTAKGSAKGPVEGSAEGSVEGSAVDEDVVIAVAGVDLAGRLSVPAGAGGLIVFAHGSGSGRHSPRNEFVAGVLREARLGTLLFDLLTPAEEADRRNVFDIELLAGRLVEVVGWVRTRPALATTPIGLFGASTGAAAALWAAADIDVFAVVSRGGRPDLAGDRLGRVRAPTLLIVGGHDDVVLELNLAAQARLRCPNELTVVPGAGHLFEEPGTLRRAARSTRDWFTEHLPSSAAPA
jgi:putative phosphoribosyl transferase